MLSGQLLGSGHAYHSTATAEDVKAYKQLHGAERGFRGEGRAGGQEEGAVRLRVPDEGATVVHDAIRGETRFEHVHLDDPVIARTDGSLLYNIADADDDLDAGNTHDVRGEDHLSNTPKQLLVLEALGAPQPIYAHLPLLHGPDGRKLSKRHGAASVQELRAAGFLPEAVRNYLALLGWGADDATVMSTEQLVERFALERVSRNPAQFDETKLRWMNGIYIRGLPVGELTRRIVEYINREASAGARDRPAAAGCWSEAVDAISQEKIQTLADFWPLAGFFFQQPVEDQPARERWLDELLAGGTAHAGARGAGAAGGVTFAEDRNSAVQEGDAPGVQQRLGVKPREVYPLRCAWHSPAPRYPRGSSRALRCWAARRPCDASMPPLHARSETSDVRLAADYDLKARPAADYRGVPAAKHLNRTSTPADRRSKSGPVG